MKVINGKRVKLSGSKRVRFGGERKKKKARTGRKKIFKERL